MRKVNRFITAAVLGLATVACSSPTKMIQLAENVKTSCDPSVLEVIAGKIDATVTASVPEGYFLPKAVVEVTPVLVYDGGEAAMSPFVFQGDKVKDNYKVVSSKGATVRENVHFDYEEGMEQARLELRGVVKYKNKSYALPVRKIADGCNTTYMLAEAEGYVPLKEDGYQEIIKQTEEGQILYKINSANVDNSQLRSKSIKDFQAALDEIKNNGRKTLTGTEVVAYASPDGAESLNNKLSDNRSKSGEKAFNQITKGKEVANTTVKSVGEDWEGFKELVENSNIQDKDLILRVLSMYSDPAVRESEIKNISEVYTDLKSSVLPELRRARFIANVEYKNYNEEELLKMVEENYDVLDETALLHAATLVQKPSEMISLYKKAIDKYDSDRARFNLGAVYLAYNRLNDAEKAFRDVKTKDADLQNALGAVALQKGDYTTAANYFKQAGTEASKYNQGVMDILQGNYGKAAAELKGFTGMNPALANLLNGDLDAASKALTCQCPRSNYLRAIIAARKGDAAGVSTYLAKAKANKTFADRAEKDIEFAQYR